MCPFEVSVKLKIEKSVLIKLLLIGAVFFIAPQAIPFALEFVLMVDIIGLEALVLLLIYQSRHLIAALMIRLAEWRAVVSATILLLASAYIFQPRIFLSHAAGSSLLLFFACSLAMALAIWIPAIYFSGSGFV